MSLVCTKSPDICFDYSSLTQSAWRGTTDIGHSQEHIVLSFFLHLFTEAWYMDQSYRINPHIQSPYQFSESQFWPIHINWAVGSDLSRRFLIHVNSAGSDFSRTYLIHVNSVSLTLLRRKLNHMNAVVLIFEEPAARQIFFRPHPISTEILKIQNITQIRSSWIQAHKIKIEIEIPRLDRPLQCQTDWNCTSRWNEVEIYRDSGLQPEIAQNTNQFQSQTFDYCNITHCQH
jgi:hypothetical protein